MSLLVSARRIRIALSLLAFLLSALGARPAAAAAPGTLCNTPAATGCAGTTSLTTDTNKIHYDIHPGQTVNLDYSLTLTLPLQRSLRLQIGLVGYGQWQTTDKHGPNVTPEQATAHYKVTALGFTANAALPEQKVNIGLKYFREFKCRSTYQGYTLQISAAISF